MMRVSVVIPHLQGVSTLLPLLDDLQREKEDVDSLEVILIDNASRDEQHPTETKHADYQCQKGARRTRRLTADGPLR